MNKIIAWEMIAVIITSLGIVYMIGKKEGVITSEVQQNRRGIQQLSHQIDDLSKEMNRLFREENHLEANVEFKQQ